MRLNGLINQLVLLCVIYCILYTVYCILYTVYSMFVFLFAYNIVHKYNNFNANFKCLLYVNPRI
jgi:hypothetical protein